MSEQPAEEIDPDRLRRDIDAIKDVMDIEERYPGQSRMWLAYGGIIGIASIATNLAFTVPLPNWAYIAGWLFLVVVIGLAQWRLVSRTSGPVLPGIDWRQVFLVLVVGYVGLSSAVGDLIATHTADALRGIHFFSHVVLFLGIGMLLVGVLLGAERIALRDRMPFYVAGVWMIALAGIMPHVELLHLVGWGLFGVLFLVNSIGAYLLSTRG